MPGRAIDRSILLSRYERAVLHEQADGPCKTTEQAYNAVTLALLADGTTCANAFGRSGWYPVSLSEPYADLSAMLAGASLARRNADFPFAVSNENHNGAFLGDDAINLAFRAHHDALHCLYEIGFTLDDEAEVAARTVNQLNVNLDAATVIVGEIIGQGLYFDRYGRFPLVNEYQQPFVPVNPVTRKWARHCLEILATTETFWS